MCSVLTPSGYKDYSLLSVGDEVCYFDEFTGLTETNIILEKEAISEWIDLENKFILINGTYTLYHQQSIWRNTHEVTHAYLLEVGDIIYSDTDRDIEITSIVETTSEIFYRFEISGDHSYIADGITLHNASRFLVGGGTGNWNSNTNWAATSGGASGASFPVAADTVTMDTASGATAITVNVTSACTSLIQTATFTGTVTMNANMAVSSTFTLIAGATWTKGAGILQLGSTSCNITSAGKAIGHISFSVSSTKTLQDNFDVDNFNPVGAAVILNGFQITINGNLTMTGSSSGTSNLIVAATNCTWSGGGGVLKNNLTINLGVAFTISGSVIYGIGTFTINSTTVTSTGSTLTIQAGCTLDTKSQTLGNITLGGTITNNSALVASGTLNCPVGVTTILNGSSISFGGNLTHSPGVAITGTANLIATGICTWTQGTAGIGFKNNLKFASTSVLTISGAVSYSTGDFLFESTSNVANVSSGSLTFTATVNSVTLNAAFVFTGTVTCNVGFTFAGSAGFSIGTLILNTTGITIRLTYGNTYATTQQFTVNGTLASPIVFNSTSAGNKVVFNLGGTSSYIDVGYCTLTDIDSSGGFTGFNYKGVISNSLNWYNLLPPITKIYLSIN